jgi:P27 family predicted phage terminase small subunit
LPKEEGRAQGHRRRDASSAGLHSVAVVAIPEAPEGLLESTLEAWRAYWRSDVAQAVGEENMVTVRRLFELIDQRDRAMEIVRQTLVVRGSKDQLRLNPVADLVTKLETAILRLETELGLTPMSRARLGIATGQAQLTLEEMNERFREGQKPSRRKDPRLEALPAAD